MGGCGAGDLFQIKPVGAGGLFSLALDRSVGRVRSTKGLPINDLNGIDLFLDFKSVDLKIDERAIDPQHARIVADMRKIAGLGMKGGMGPISNATTKYLKERILTRAEYMKDGSLLNAPIVVTSNRERGVIMSSRRKGGAGNMVCQLLCGTTLLTMARPPLT